MFFYQNLYLFFLNFSFEVWISVVATGSLFLRLKLWFSMGISISFAGICFSIRISSSFCFILVSKFGSVWLLVFRTKPLIFYENFYFFCWNSVPKFESIFRRLIFYLCVCISISFLISLFPRLQLQFCVCIPIFLPLSLTFTFSIPVSASLTCYVYVWKLWTISMQIGI